MIYWMTSMLFQLEKPELNSFMNDFIKKKSTKHISSKMKSFKIQSWLWMSRKHVQYG